jgi:mannose-6-phosphate isomerase-like protein (cupin superfamily)
MWRRWHDREEIVDVEAGVAISIPVGAHFQFRSGSHEPLAAVGTTMPPWPGEDEAVAVDGPWTPTV